MLKSHVKVPSYTVQCVRACKREREWAYGLGRHSRCQESSAGDYSLTRISSSSGLLRVRWGWNKLQWARRHLNTGNLGNTACRIANETLPCVCTIPPYWKRRRKTPSNYYCVIGKRRDLSFVSRIVRHFDQHSQEMIWYGTRRWRWWSSPSSSALAVHLSFNERQLAW